MSTQRTLTLAQLVAREYAGLSRERVIAIIIGPSGLSRHAVAAALSGRRVRPETAQYLAAWALEVHKASLDVTALVMAPTRKPAPKRMPAVLAAAELRAAGLPGNLHYDAVVRVSARAYQGAPDVVAEASAADLGCALTALSATLKTGQGGTP